MDKKEFDKSIKYLNVWQRRFYNRKAKEIDNGTIKNLNITLDSKKDASDKRSVLRALSSRIKKFEIKSIEDVLKFEALPRTMFHWGQQSGNNLKPAIAEKSDDCFGGDGKKLIHVSTVNDRPLYYLLQVDSGFTFEDDEDGINKIETILEHLEFEFGSADSIKDTIECGEGDYTEDDIQFPLVDLSCGYSWGEFALDFSDWRLYDV